MYCFFFSSRRRHTRSLCDWSSDVCSSDLFVTVSSRLRITLATVVHAASSAASSFSLRLDRKSTRLNSSHTVISYAVFCLKKKNKSTRCGAETWHSQAMDVLARQIHHLKRS